MTEELPLRQKNVHFILHPAEQLIERDLGQEEIKKIIYKNYIVPDAISKYPDTKIAIGRIRGEYWSVPHTEHPQDIFVITARPSKQYEIDIYKKMIRERWKK